MSKKKKDTRNFSYTTSVISGLNGKPRMSNDARLMLFAVARFGGKTGKLSAGIQTLANEAFGECSYSTAKRRVRPALEELVLFGFISNLVSHKNETHKADLTEKLINGGPQAISLNTRSSSQIPASNTAEDSGSDLVLDRGPDLDPDLSKNGSKNDPQSSSSILSLTTTSSSSSVEPQRNHDEVEAASERIIRHQKATHGISPSREARAVLRCELEHGVSEEEIIDAITFAKDDAFSNGANKLKKKFLDLLSILKNRERIVLNRKTQRKDKETYEQMNSVRPTPKIEEIRPEFRNKWVA